LIALIINVHTLGRMYLQAIPKDASCKRTLNEKTSYCFVRSNRWRAVKLANKDRFTTRRSCDRHAPKTIWRYANDAPQIALQDPNPDRSPLHDVRKPARLRIAQSRRIQVADDEPSSLSG
jgi:hypothetical protein